MRHTEPKVLAATAVAMGSVVAWLRRYGKRTKDGELPADIGFIQAIHDAFRRDLKRLHDAASSSDDPSVYADSIRPGWDTFRDQLSYHHAAEDDNLWPVLCAHLTQDVARREVDAMVTEHRQIPPALDAVRAALDSGASVSAAVEHLRESVLQHLEHEERTVFPLLEQHLTRKEWRAFLRTERDGRKVSERRDFLTWVLDEATDKNRDSVFSELPLPARLDYRFWLRPRYNARHAWGNLRNSPTASSDGRGHQ